LIPDLVYQQEYLARFVDFGGTLIEREWIRYGEPEPSQVVSTAIGVDLAISIKEDACYTAFVVMQNTFDGKLWVRACLKERLKFHKIIEKLTAFGKKWNPDVINIEDVQFQAAVVQEMLRTTKMNIKGCTPEKGHDKLIRFLPLQPRYRAHLIHHSSSLPTFFQRDVLGFPSSGENDIPDAFVYAFRGLRMPSRGAVSTGKRETSALVQTSVNSSGGGWGTVGEH
jgi:predicted phage terminase large subunit-like protein